MYFFVLIMKVLSCLLEKVMKGGFLSSLKVMGKNALIFCKGSQDQMVYLSWILM